MKVKVFVSHAWDDKRFGAFKKIQLKLEDAHDLFIDRSGIEAGQNIREILEEKISLMNMDPTQALGLIRSIIGEAAGAQLDQMVGTTVGQVVQANYFQQLAQWNQTMAYPSQAGGAGSWGGSWEDEMARQCAQLGVSF